MNLSHVGLLGEGMAVAEGNVDDTVVSEGGHGIQRGSLCNRTVSANTHNQQSVRTLSSTRCAGRNVQRGVLASQGALGPEPAGRIPEGLETTSITLIRRVCGWALAFHWAGKLP